MLNEKVALMKTIPLKIEAAFEIDISDLANALSDMPFDDFAQLMARVFSNIESSHNDDTAYQRKLSWIAEESPIHFKTAVLKMAEFHKKNEPKS